MPEAISASTPTPTPKPIRLTPKEFDSVFSDPQWSLNCCSALFSAIQEVKDSGTAKILANIGEKIATDQSDLMSSAQTEILRRYLEEARNERRTTLVQSRRDSSDGKGSMDRAMPRS